MGEYTEAGVSFEMSFLDAGNFLGMRLIWGCGYPF